MKVLRLFELERLAPEKGRSVSNSNPNSISPCPYYQKRMKEGALERCAVSGC
jgi:hypothetical protein